MIEEKVERNDQGQFKDLSRSNAENDVQRNVEGQFTDISRSIDGRFAQD